MSQTQPQESKEEFARRGDMIYQREVLPYLGAQEQGKFIAIDVDTGAYEIDANEMEASDHLLARCPNARVWLRRVGSRYVRRFGARSRTGAP